MIINRQFGITSKHGVSCLLLCLLLIYIAPIISQQTFSQDTHHHQALGHRHHAMQHDGHQRSDSDSSLIPHWCGYCKLLYHLNWHNHFDIPFRSITITRHSGFVFTYEFGADRWLTKHRWARAPPRHSLF